MQRAYVLLSGGVDSTTCLYVAKRDWPEVVGVSVFYGQRHSKEIEAAAVSCHRLGVRHHVLDIRGVIPKTMLTDPDAKVPDISYSEIQGVSPTYVSFRNGLLLSAASSFIQGERTDESYHLDLEDDEWGLYFGAHAEDAHNWAYPDCTPEWIGAMANAIYIGTYRQLRLITPLEWLGKADIVRLGQSVGVKWADTWSCLARGTLVRTLANSSGEPIEEIKEGRWIWGFDDVECRWIPTQVEAFVYRGVKEVFEVTLRDQLGRFKKFKATADHRLQLRDNGYARVDELSYGDRLMPSYTSIVRPGATKTPYFIIHPHGDWKEPPVYMHRYVADFFGIHDRGVIHHGPGGSLNNDPGNLSSMEWGEHTRHHTLAAKDRIWNNDLNAARARAVAKRWSEMTPEEYAKRCEAISRGKLMQNHTFIGAVKIGEDRTYDLQTGTENFALGAGIFVHNCYVGGGLHCGVCPTCRARRQGFLDAGVDDPTVYVQVNAA